MSRFLVLRALNRLTGFRPPHIIKAGSEDFVDVSRLVQVTEVVELPVGDWGIVFKLLSLISLVQPLLIEPIFYFLSDRSSKSD